MLIVKNSAENIEQLIMEYEGQLGISIPIELKRFLVKYNGGETPKTQFIDKALTTDIRAFYGLGDVEYSYHNTNYTEKSGKGLLAFALDSFGNKFLIEVFETNEIYFLDHEKENGLILASRSLMEFIMACKSEKISDASRRSPEEREKDLINKGKGNNISDGLREMWKVEYERCFNLYQEEVIL